MMVMSSLFWAHLAQVNRHCCAVLTLKNPNQGRILIGNEELMLKPVRSGELQAADVKEESLRARVGFVFQNFNLWPHKTILQNIIEGPTQVLKIKKAQAISDAEKPRQSRFAR